MLAEFESMNRRVRSTVRLGHSVGGQIEPNAKATGVAAAPIPAATNDSVARGAEPWVTRLLEPLTIDLGRVARKVTDRGTININPYGVAIVGIGIFEDQRRSAMLLSAIFGSAAAGFLKRVLIVRLTNNLDFESARSAQRSRFGCSSATRSMEYDPSDAGQDDHNYYQRRVH